jgi:predicted SAM-dependent methyltransferase
MKLNIGARTRAEGWHTFDIVPGPEVDFVGDCRDLAQFAANSVDTIYASHVLEHVRYATELAPTLKRWFLVLKPGGMLMISVPDLRTLCHLFLHPKAQMGDRFQIMRMMFGGQMDPHDLHYVGFDFEILGQYLFDAGFREIRKVEDFKLFRDTSLQQFAGVPISLNVSAQKPAGPA